jgi:hypothetical protein
LNVESFSIGFGFVVEEDIKGQIASNSYPGKVGEKQVSGKVGYFLELQNIDEDRNPHNNNIKQSSSHHLLREEQPSPGQVPDHVHSEGYPDSTHFTTPFPNVHKHRNPNQNVQNSPDHHKSLLLRSEGWFLQRTVPLEVCRLPRPDTHQRYNVLIFRFF